MVLPVGAAEALVTMESSRPATAGERIYRARRIAATFGRIYLGVRANRFVAKRLRPRDMKQRWSDFNRNSA